MTDKLEKLINKAEYHRYHNNLDEVLILYEKICKIDKNNPDAWMTFGVVAGHLGKYSDAETALRKACKLRSQYGKQQAYLVQALEAQGKFDEAINILLEQNPSDGTSASLYLKLGVLYGKNNDFENSIQSLTSYVNIVHDDAYAFHCLASAYESLEHYTKADKYFKKAITLSSNDYKLINSYGAMLQKSGNLEEAIKQYLLSITINNNYALSQYNIATAYNITGEYEKAVEFFSKAISLKNDYIEAIIGVGKSYRAIGESRLAIKELKKAVDLDRDCAEAYLHLGLAQVSEGDYDEANNSLSTADKINPDDIEIRCARVTLYERRGEFNLAENTIRPLLASHPDNKDVVFAYSNLCKAIGECDQSLRLIKERVSDSTLHPVYKSALHFKAGKICDDMQEYDDAFHHYELANNLQPYKYDESIVQQSLSNIKSMFSSEVMGSFNKSTNNSNAPIFILGMPRSGTTLVEQILSSHPDVFGGGEMPLLSSISNKLGGAFITGKHCITSLPETDIMTLDNLADEYLSFAMADTKDESFITDKMPHNFRLIGLINILFPNANIIHCTRNPIDNCLSIYFSNFNVVHPYSGKLEDIARYYTDYYQSLMSHWYKTSSINILDVRYEDIIDNLKDSSMRILEHCGIEWDDVCLDFHNSKRDVATLSYDQVRQPIYNKSIERWRNYDKYITSLTKHFEYHLL